MINIEKKFRLFLKKMPNYLLNILLGVSGFFVLYVIFGVEILKKIEIFKKEQDTQADNKRRQLHKCAGGPNA